MALLVNLAAPVVPPSIASISCPEAESQSSSENVEASTEASVFAIIGAEEVASSDDSGECHQQVADGEPRVLVEEACPQSNARERTCIADDCGPGKTAMISYPIVDGVADRTSPRYFCAGAGLRSVRSRDVLRAIRNIGLPASKLSIQPPGGKTLVNFDTIFSTSADQITPSIRVAGIPVRVRIWPSAYTWHWGDETEPVSTEEPGRAYERGVPMEDYITHQYVDADVTVKPRVDVTYAAEFSVRGGVWQPVNGTVTIDGSSASLRIVEARPVLTGAS
jgi:hypothetical protein